MSDNDIKAETTNDRTLSDEEIAKTALVACDWHAFVFDEIFLVFDDFPEVTRSRLMAILMKLVQRKLVRVTGTSTIVYYKTRPRVLVSLMRDVLE